MRARIGWIAVACLCVAAVAFGQRITTIGDGVTGQPSQRLSLIPQDQWFTITYPWVTVPSTSVHTGWYQQQSTAAGVPVFTLTPFLELDATTDDQRVLVSEMSGSSTGAIGGAEGFAYALVPEVSVGVVLPTLSNFAGSVVHGWFQFNCGDDTTNFVVNKKPPGSDFGVLLTGATKANSAYAPDGVLTAYVASGSDTTYLALGAPPADPVKLWIHAAPNGGPVDFWVNGVLKGTISSPVRVGNNIPFVSMWLNGDSGINGFAVGPVVIQRPTQ